MGAGPPATGLWPVFRGLGHEPQCGRCARTIRRIIREARSGGGDTVSAGRAQMNAWSAALQSGTILLREGLEAMLVIAALAAIVRRAGAAPPAERLYGGAILAVLASLAAAVVFELYLNGAHDDRLEAAVMIVAADAAAVHERLVVRASGSARMAG